MVAAIFYAKRLIENEGLHNQLPEVLASLKSEDEEAYNVGKQIYEDKMKKYYEEMQKKCRYQMP